MRPYQVFAAMSDETAVHFFGQLAEQSPVAFQQAVLAASAALKSRPQYLRRQPADRQARAARRALSRVGADEIAEQTLAAYFLECRKPLLIEWLDQLKIAHDEGALKDDDPAQPSAEQLTEAVRSFRAGDGEDRELLLQAFAAQRSIEWGELDSLIKTF